MHAIIQSLKADENGRRQADLKLYAQLLDSPDQAKVSELKSVMERLGKTTDQVHDDHQYLLSIKDAEERIRRGSGLDDAIVAAEKAVRDHHAETERIVAERQGIQKQLNNESSRLQTMRTGAIEEHRRMVIARQHRGDLLKHRDVLPHP